MAGLEDLNDEQLERYARHLVLPEIDEQGQAKLINARIGLIGLGGLGCPAAQILAASGIGHLRLIDPDVVELSNLQRQILHTTEDIGRPKVLSARDSLAKLNADVALDPRQSMLDDGNAKDLLSDLDLVIDGCDSASARTTAAQMAEELEIPLVSGALFQGEGQVSLFRPYLGVGHPALKQVFPELDQSGLELSCAAAGVYAPLCMMIGSWMASEAIKAILGHPNTLDGKLLIADMFGLRTRVLII